MKIVTVFYMFIGFINAHVFMKYPICRKSKYSYFYIKNNLVDYDIMAPLNSNGYSFPCKGFPISNSTTVINSNFIDIILEPGTSPDSTHNGGICQFGLSFDNKLFIVLKQIKRCMHDNLLNYNLELPESVPNGNLIFFWTWINSVGNREYYMDCSDINLKRNRTNFSNNTIIYGKELIIVNLPGFKQIPEFPSGDSLEGNIIIDSAKNIQLNITEVYTK
jgi:hypothetical protein